MKNLLLAATALLLAAAAPAPNAAPRSRTFLLMYKATVPMSAAGVKKVELWLPVPHSDKNQDVTNLRIKTGPPYMMASKDDTLKSYTIATDQYGNQMLHMVMSTYKIVPRESILTEKQIAQLPDEPVGPITVTLTARVTRREHLNLRATDDHAPAETEATDPNLQRWLAPDRLVPLDAKIKAQAQEVVAKAGAKTDLQKARAIYEHVVSTVTYDKTGQGWGRGDIYYACDARRGNCTDFHAIVIGYCRALGIPARFSIGLPLPAGHGKGEIKGYHCWAEFFTKQTGWVPVDASEAAKNPDKRNYFFGAHDENRVEFTRGRDLVLMPKQAGPPLNYFVYPYAEADGQPVENVERTYTFEDVAQ